MGYEPFTNPLEPGDKITYNVKMPLKPGYYVVMLLRHPKDGGGISLWGLNRMQYSNIFQVKLQ
jgi:hypothetical protein